MTRYAGLEIDRSHLRMAILEGNSKKYALVDYIEAEIAADSDEERREVLAGILTDVLSRKENQGIEVVSGLDARSVMLREISVPYLKDEMIAKTIRFEAESYLHAKAIEDVIVEYLKCGETETSSRLMICAVEKDVLRNHLDELRVADVDPLAVELDATALATTFANNESLYSGEQNVLLLELEPDCSRMVFIEKDRVTKVRSVWGRSSGIERPDRLLETAAEVESTNGVEDPGADQDSGNGAAPAAAPASPSAGIGGSDRGGNEIEDRFREIEKSLLDLDQPDDSGLSPGGELPIAVVSDEEYARLTGSAPAASHESSTSAATEVENGDPDATPEEARTTTLAIARESDPLERLFIEIERTFAAFVLTNPVDLIVVTGSCAEQWGAVERIADRFEVDVVPLDLADSIPIEWEGAAEELNRTGAVACGLGLRALGKGLSEFDLRQEEFKFERRFAKLMPALTLLSVLLAALTFLWAFHSFYEDKRVSRESDALRTRQSKLFESFFGKPPRNPSNVLREAKDDVRDLLGPGGKSSRPGSRARFKNYMDPLEMFEDLMTCVKQAQPRVYPKWESFDFTTEIDKGKSKFKVLLKSNDEVIAFENALRKSKLFRAKLGSDTSKDGDVVVDVELTLLPAVINARGTRGKSRGTN